MIRVALTLSPGAALHAPSGPGGDLSTEALVAFVIGFAVLLLWAHARLGGRAAPWPADGADHRGARWSARPRQRPAVLRRRPPPAARPLTGPANVGAPVPKTRHAAHRTPGRRALKLLGGATLLIGALSALALGAIYGSLPSTADAPARVRAIDAHATSRPITLSPHDRFAQAVVALEDEHFYQHGAIDPQSLARALGRSLTASADPGGSTITQQLAKVLYIKNPESVLGRLRAVGLALKLERRYTKDQILTMYANAVYFGHGFYGLLAASHGYFAKDPSTLSWTQASLLAGLPQAPTALDPLTHLPAARARQREVLAQLTDNHALTAAAAQRISHAPLHLTR